MKKTHVSVDTIKDTKIVIDNWIIYRLDDKNIAMVEDLGGHYDRFKIRHFSSLEGAFRKLINLIPVRSKSVKDLKTTIKHLQELPEKLAANINL